MATYTLISSVTVGSGGASSISFSSIPSNYTDLLIKLSIRTNRSDAVNDFLKIAFNSSSASYSARFLQGTGSSAASYTESVAANIVGDVNASPSTTSTFGNMEIYIPNYTSSNNKSISVDAVTENNATTAPMDILSGLWSNTSAITNLSFTAGVGSALLQYSTAYLYGIKNS